MMKPSDNPFVATWSAKGNLLCSGHWEIRFHGVALALPPAQAENHMDTYGIFNWLFPDDDAFTEGLLIHNWIEQHADWLLPFFERNGIPVDEQHIEWFYEAVSQNDWRCGSCGGCL